MQENLKVSTLIQGMKPDVKRHILLNIGEDTKYNSLRQYLVNYESTERWTNSLSQQQGTPHRTTTDLIDTGEDHGGLAAMDVNRAWIVTKAKVKAKHSQRQEFATTVIGMDTLKHSVGRSRWTWDTKLGP